MCSLLIDKVTARMTWTRELVGPKAEAQFPVNDSKDFANLVVLLEANIMMRLAAFSVKLLEFTQDCFGAITNSITVVIIALIAVTVEGVFLFATFSIVLRNGFELIASCSGFCRRANSSRTPNWYRSSWASVPTPTPKSWRLPRSLFASPVAFAAVRTDVPQLV
jgi:hypothetical protein